MNINIHMRLTTGFLLLSGQTSVSLTKPSQDLLVLLKDLATLALTPFV